jgi:hypothetical protein
MTLTVVLEYRALLIHDFLSREVLVAKELTMFRADTRGLFADDERRHLRAFWNVGLAAAVRLFATNCN